MDGMTPKEQREVLMLSAKVDQQISETRTLEPGESRRSVKASSAHV